MRSQCIGFYSFRDFVNIDNGLFPIQWIIQRIISYTVDYTTDYFLSLRDPSRSQDSSSWSAFGNPKVVLMVIFVLQKTCQSIASVGWIENNSLRTTLKLNLRQDGVNVRLINDCGKSPCCLKL